MRLLITSEAHFLRGSAGEVYGDGPANYAFWSKYLEVFGEVAILARVRQNGPYQMMSGSRCDGQGVAFRGVPDYSGLSGCLRVFLPLARAIRESVAESDVCIARVPGILGSLVWREAKKQGKTCALEVLGDPWSSLGPGSWPSPLRPVVRRLAAHQLRKMCQGAVAINYVTQASLQKRYPPGSETYAIAASDAMIENALAPPDVIASRVNRIDSIRAVEGRPAARFRIGFLGSLARLYKGPDILLRAAHLCRRKGLNFQLLVAGEGRHAEEMKRLAEHLRIADRVEFLGQLPFGAGVIDFLDSLDLFVLPSRDEGLPRALLEAMSRGCPCIASRVGGIPELLPAESMVEAENANELAQAIMAAACNPEQLKRMSFNNLERARQFSPQALGCARSIFFQEVKLRAGLRQIPSRSPQEAVL